MSDENLSHWAISPLGHWGNFVISRFRDVPSRLGKGCTAVFASAQITESQNRKIDEWRNHEIKKMAQWPDGSMTQEGCQ